MKFFRTLALVVALMLAIVPLSACGTPAPTEAPDDDGGVSILPASFKAVDSLNPGTSNALTGFSLDLFRRLAAADAGKNVFVSPLSVWLALSMTYNGAAGATAMGMAEALHASNLSINDLNKDNAGLMGVLTAADPKVAIAIANSIWMRKGLEGDFNKDFLDRDQQYYAAQIKALDFADSGAAGVINRWVEANTNGNIKNLIEPPIDPQTVMFLINAVHFKAPWKTAFDPKKTVDGEFAAADGKPVQVKYMTNEDDNVGFADENLVAVRIPYAAGRLEMVALMPPQQPIADFLKGLTPETLKSAIDKCEKTSMTLSFPKFKLEYEATLNDTLIAMGMEEAFDGDGADFSNMSEKMGKELFISKVRHKSFIEVNEEGTEASAATSVEMRLTGMPMALRFDKPFVYLIRDTKTGAILFIGVLENPS
jgi:serine protease inhibitor